MKLPCLSYLVVVSLSIFLATLATIHGDSNRHPSKYCDDTKCDIAVNDLLDCRDQSVSPCDDFYQHACGGCKGLTDGYFDRLYSKVNKQMMELFNDTQISDGEAIKKSKELYDSCMAWDDVTNSPMMFIERVLTDNGEWPIIVPLDEWNNRNLTWQEIHENFVNRVGISALFDVKVGIDPRLNSHQLRLSIPVGPSGRSNYDPSYLEWITSFVDNIRISRVLNVTRKDILDDISGIVELGNKLNKAFKKDAHGGRRITIETLQNDWDAIVPRNSTYSINWLKTINDRFEGTGIVIDASENIRLMSEFFVADLARALVDTPVRTIVNYLHFLVVWTWLINVLVYQLYGNISPMFTSGRSEYCITHHLMDHTIGYIYAKKHFSEKLRSAALEIIQQIRDEMKQEINDSLWLDDTTKSLAWGKVDDMKINLGYPEWYDEPGKIDEYYRELTVGPDYIHNFRSYVAFMGNQELSKLRSPVAKSETELSRMSYEYTVSYNRVTNTLDFPAGSFQLSTLDFDRPSVLNYGAFGIIAAYEIAHGFASLVKYYKNASNRKWWTNSTMDPFESKLQCFVEQYNKYTFKDENNTKAHMKHTQNQEENIADTVGCRAGLRTYRRAKNEGKINNVQIRSSTHVTDERLYFYQFANTFCTSKEAKDTLTDSLTHYSPDRLRVIGTVSNLQEFADAFQCPIGSPMNPSKKCLIWD